MRNDFTMFAAIRFVSLENSFDGHWREKFGECLWWWIWRGDEERNLPDYGTNYLNSHNAESCAYEAPSAAYS